MNEQMRLRLCQLVSGLVASDEQLDPKERAFVERMVKSFDLEHSVDEILTSRVEREQAIEAMRELPAMARQVGMLLLVQAASADGRIVQQERDFLYAIADAIEMSRQDVDARLEAAISAAD